MVRIKNLLSGDSYPRDASSKNHSGLIIVPLDFIIRMMALKNKLEDTCMTPQSQL